MSYFFPVYMIVFVVLGFRAGSLKNKLVGYLRTYYPDISDGVLWSPWFAWNRVISVYCRDHDVEDVVLDHLKQSAIRATFVFYLWALSLAALFALLLAATYLLS